MIRAYRLPVLAGTLAGLLAVYLFAAPGPPPPVAVEGATGMRFSGGNPTTIIAPTLAVPADTTPAFDCARLRGALVAAGGTDGPVSRVVVTLRARRPATVTVREATAVEVRQGPPPRGTPVYCYPLGAPAGPADPLAQPVNLELTRPGVQVPLTAVAGEEQAERIVLQAGEPAEVAWQVRVGIPASFTFRLRLRLDVDGRPVTATVGDGRQPFRAVGPAAAGEQILAWCSTEPRPRPLADPNRRPACPEPPS